jgi:hypothetical protein
LWAKSESLRDRLLAGFRPDEVTALAGFLHRVTEAMAPPAGDGRRTTPPKAARR